MKQHKASIRPLVVLLLVAGLVAADEAEDRAIAVIEKLGGSFVRDEKKAEQPVVMVRLADTQVTDAGLKELAALKQLEVLSLERTNVTDAGLKELAALKQLQALILRGTKVTDAGLKELAALKQLQALILERTNVT